VHVFHPLAGRAPSTTCFIRDGVTTEWPCGLWLWGFRRRSCTPFQALVMVKSIHRTGDDSCICTSNTVKATGLRYASGSSKSAFRCEQGLRVHFKV